VHSEDILREALTQKVPRIAGLPANLFYTIADRRMTERGLDYFRWGKVLSLQLSESDEPPVLLARVSGSSVYKVAYGVRDQAIVHSCNCPAHESYRTCKHVVAVSALVYYLFQQKLFSRFEPKAEYIQGIWAGLAKSAGFDGYGVLVDSGKAVSGEADKDARFIACVHPWGEVRIEAQGHVGNTMTRRRLGWYRYDSYRGKHIWEYHSADPAATLCQFVKEARQHKLPVCVADDDENLIELTGEMKTAPSQYQLDLTPNGSFNAFAQPKGVDSKDVFPFYRETLLTRAGDFVRMPNKAAERLLLDMADPTMTLNIKDRTLSSAYFIGDEDEEDYADERFNAYSLLIPEKRQQRALEVTQLKYKGQPVDLPDPAQPVEMDVQLNVYPADIDGMHMAQLQMRVNGEMLHMPEDLAEIVGMELAGRDIDDRLTSAKKRRAVLLEASQQLFSCKTMAEAKRLIQSAADDDSFKALRLKRKAVMWLNRFYKHYVKPDKDAHLLAVPESEQPWVYATSPVGKLVQAALGLSWVDPLLEAGNALNGINMYDSMLTRFLQRAALVCTATDIRLTFNNRDIRSETVSIEVEAFDTGDIDWFELRPEIRCGKLTIPQDDWERLIRGELLLEQDGELIMPSLTQAEAMEKLAALFSTKKKSKGRSKAEQATAQISRLQILDWLELRKAGAKVRLPAAAEKLFEQLAKFEKLPSVKMPKNVDATLREYQQSGYEWLTFLYNNRFGACLADDMGLGKTLQALCLLAWIKSQRKKKDKHLPHLAVLPPSLVFNWHHEAERFCPSLKVGEHIGQERDIEKLKGCDLILTTYDIARRDIKTLENMQFDVVVFDEAQQLKNITAVRTKAAHKLKRRFTVCLTGTPMENHVGEYFSIMNLALPGIFGEYKEFVKSVKQGDPHLLGRAKPFILRRTKTEILKDLPPKTESDFYLDMTDEQKEIYTRTVAEVREEVLSAYKDKTKAQAGIVALAALMRLRQVCISPELLGKTLKHPAPKIDYLLGKMDELIGEGHAALIFSQFTKTLDVLEKAAAEANLPTLRLDGKVPGVKRKKLVETFQNDAQPHLFLISLKAGGVGLNLTRAQYVFHADPWWNPAVENQASDRAHRIGQKQAVFVQRILMRHSVEEKIMELKRRKQKLFDLIIESGAKKGQGTSLLAKEDFEYLLSD